MSDNTNNGFPVPEEPLTREEQYLSAIAGVTASSDIPEKPLTRVEAYLNKIVENGGGGGGGGTTNYNALENKPQINGTTLSGNKSSSDLGLQDTISFEGTYDSSNNKAATMADIKDGKLTGYAQTSGNVAATDKVIEAIGKIEKKADDNQSNISSFKKAANTDIYFTETEPTGDISNGSYWISTSSTKIYDICYQMYDVTTQKISGKYIRAGNASEQSPLGSEVDNVAYNCTDYIAVNPNTTYTVQYPVRAEASGAGMVYYTSNNTAISGVSMQAQGETYTFTTPENCNSIRLSYLVSGGDEVMLNAGNTALPYQEYFVTGWK